MSIFDILHQCISGITPQISHHYKKKNKQKNTNEVECRIRPPLYSAIIIHLCVFSLTLVTASCLAHYEKPSMLFVIYTTKPDNLTLYT